MTTPQAAMVFNPDAFMEALRNAGYTPQEFADELSANRTTVALWLAGMAEPKRSMLRAAARVLGVDESYLLVEAG